MKKFILSLVFALISAGTVQSQCQNLPCSTYVVAPITFTTFPTTGVSLSLSDDAMSGTIPLGFNFEFYCNSYSQADISSNGFLTFVLNTGLNGCCAGAPVQTGA